MLARSRHPLFRPLLVGWAIASTVLCLAYARSIAHWWFPDPDDAMRLLQVRDWIGGQSWWDVDQHRLWGGAFRMHWSRLVDLPLAGVIVLATPLLGSDAAATLAMVLVPLATLFAIMGAAALLTERLAGEEAAGLALMLVPLSIPVVYQASPLRIDHHGWQIALALAAALAVVTRTDRRSGIAAGAALATLLTISLEGLPIAAAITGIALLAWALRPERRRQALALALSMPAVLLTLHLLTRGPQAVVTTCDAVAPAWIAAIGAACLLAATIVGMSWRHPLARVAGLGIAAAGGAAVLLRIAPACVAGPFATLEPLVRTMWYEQVSEGLPVWKQAPAWAAITVALPLVGSVGTYLAWRASAGERRTGWAMLGAVLFAATLLSLLVMRSGATANALAVPGAAYALLAMLTRARALPSVPLRTAATAGALVAASPGLAGAALFGIPAASGRVVPTVASASGRTPCDRGRDMAALATALPPSTLFAPIDVTAALLAWTPHRAIGAGYHRNDAAIARVLRTFMAPPEQARALVLASGADFVVGCPGENETELYKAASPNGLWARLERGERIDWLEPVPTGAPALAWRVRQPLQERAALP